MFGSAFLESAFYISAFLEAHYWQRIISAYLEAHSWQRILYKRILGIALYISAVKKRVQKRILDIVEAHPEALSRSRENEPRSAF